MYNVYVYVYVYVYVNIPYFIGTRVSKKYQIWEIGKKI